MLYKEKLKLREVKWLAHSHTVSSRIRIWTQTSRLQNSHFQPHKPQLICKDGKFPERRNIQKRPKLGDSSQLEDWWSFLWVNFSSFLWQCLFKELQLKHFETVIVLEKYWKITVMKEKHNRDSISINFIPYGNFRILSVSPRASCWPDMLCSRLQH